MIRKYSIEINALFNMSPQSGNDSRQYVGNYATSGAMQTGDGLPYIAAPVRFGAKERA